MSALVSLRTATFDDAKMLLRWRNDPATQRASHTGTAVERDQHFSWLRASLENPNRKLFVAELNSVPVGTVRADAADGTWTLSWTVAPEARGKGIARQMVAIAVGQINEPVRAEIKRGNIASVNVATHAGMTLCREEGDILHFERAQIPE